jgi:Lecithin retinol acyltransferase
VITEQLFGNRLVAYQYAFQSRAVRLLEDEEPPIGAHLVTPWHGFAHHGVYVGGGRVIHYNARVYRLKRRPVEETGMAEFAEGRPVFIVDHAEAPLDSPEVIRRARARLGEDRYHLLDNNCEHLVEWCLHGVARSFQVESALDFPQRAGEWWWCKLFALVCWLFGIKPRTVMGTVPDS